MAGILTSCKLFRKLCFLYGPKIPALLMITTSLKQKYSKTTKPTLNFVIKFSKFIFTIISLPSTLLTLTISKAAGQFYWNILNNYCHLYLQSKIDYTRSFYSSSFNVLIEPLLQAKWRIHVLTITFMVFLEKN